MSESTPAPERPVLRVIRGDATDEEIAAVVAVLSATAAAAAAAAVPAPRDTSRWADRSTSVRSPQSRGAGAWRASGWSR